ncbi:MAG: hypothetical protein OSJ62_05405 [Lachnospiraceae bacterium]|nr:hypothetical protein [Lachnospiraceae bacterium]
MSKKDAFGREEKLSLMDTYYPHGADADNNFVGCGRVGENGT